MENRIRHFRKMHGMTLEKLGKRINTTAQTIQRLETSNMTVSTDWLEKIADVFGIEPAALLTDHTGREVPLVGALGKNALLRKTTYAAENRSLSLDIPAEDPVAVELAEPAGPYPKGCILIGNRLSGASMAGAVGKDALVAIDGETIALRKVISGVNDTFTLVPVGTDGDVLYDIAPHWVARLVMRIEYL
jgi:transcriptional regulator with XRE-family HTH domain